MRAGVRRTSEEKRGVSTLLPLIELTRSRLDGTLVADAVLSAP